MVSDNVLAFAADNYKFDKASLHFISDSTNQIYAFTKNDKPFILRFSERPLEDICQAKAEMDWLYYLSNNNINVSLPLCADNYSLVLSTEDEGKSFIISAFEALSGSFWDRNNPDLWNTRIFFKWGKLMGDIHRLTKKYVPPNEIDVRRNFTGYQALDMDNIKSCPSVCKIAEGLVSEIMALPKDEDSYGLIHYDIHPWNFIINGEEINVFDFDDSLYGWFALDIGIALYHGLWWGRKSDGGYDFSNEIIEHFIAGYLSANALSDYWIAKIPLFMRYRQVCSFSWFYDSNNVDDHQKELIYNIESGILFSDCKLDFLPSFL